MTRLQRRKKFVVKDLEMKNHERFMRQLGRRLKGAKRIWDFEKKILVLIKSKKWERLKGSVLAMLFTMT